MAYLQDKALAIVILVRVSIVFDNLTNIESIAFKGYIRIIARIHVKRMVWPLGQQHSGLQRLEVLKIEESGLSYWGGDQSWYDHYDQQVGGCGPTAAANLLAYLALTQEAYGPLFVDYPMTREGFSDFMQEVYGFVTPIKLYDAARKIDAFSQRDVPMLKQFEGFNFEVPPSAGVPTLKRMVLGVEAFAQSKGVALKAVISDLEATFENAVAYIQSGLDQDLPVVMLNAFDTVEMTYTSPHGTASVCDYGIHWVTIVGMTKDDDTQKVSLEVLTWGGTARVTLNDIWNHDLSSYVLPEAIVYFK